MSRIDVQTLVMAFERRIEALEKNPPDKVATHVILNMLEKSIDEIIKDHFLHLIKKDIQKAIRQEFKTMRTDFVMKTVEGLLADSGFRAALEVKIKNSILLNLK
jgi:hypothetical protein